MYDRPDTVPPLPTPPARSCVNIVGVITRLATGQRVAGEGVLLGPIFPSSYQHSYGSQGAPRGAQETGLLVGQLRPQVPGLMYPFNIWVCLSKID